MVETTLSNRMTEESFKFTNIFPTDIFMGRFITHFLCVSACREHCSVVPRLLALPRTVSGIRLGSHLSPTGPPSVRILRATDAPHTPVQLPGHHGPQLTSSSAQTASRPHSHSLSANFSLSFCADGIYILLYNVQLVPPRGRINLFID